MRSVENKKLIGIGVVLMLWLAGCSANPSESEMQALIGKSDAFKKQTVTGAFEEALAGTAINDPVELALKNLGYLDIQTVRNGKFTYIKLNEAGRRAARNWTQDPFGLDPIANAPAPLGFADEYDGHRHWAVPVATPEITKVSSVQQVTDSEVDVSFQYRWRPNNIGKNIHVDGDSPYKKYSKSWWEKDRTGTANLKQQEGNWIVTKIRTLGY